MAEARALFDVRGLTAVIAGGGGQLGRIIAAGLAAAGARVVVVSLHEESANAAAAGIRDAGGQALGIAADVLDRAALERALERIATEFGPPDILINAAGGNAPQATTTDEQTFFDLAPEAIERVVGLNFTSTFQCCQVFGRPMAERGAGCIVNVTSMAALRPLTRVAAYGAAKAAVANLTQWLAVHMAREYSPRIRVNAIAPGFFLTEQNRYLMTDTQTGELTPVPRPSWLTHRPGVWASPRTWWGRCSGSSAQLPSS
jgi:NAD(P)-dependent dehydrogenase (short-subunit alcohol dehydrogenase family)